MADHTQAYFDYKTTTRVVLCVVVGFAMWLGTCAYSRHADMQTEQIKAEQEYKFRQDMYEHGYQQVLKPCVPTGELIWEKQ